MRAAIESKEMIREMCMRAAGLAMAVFGCAACGDAEKAGGDDSASAVRC